jgi:hypothetical protein
MNFRRELQPSSKPAILLVVASDPIFCLLITYLTLNSDYTREEPVARGVFFVARGRALAAFGRGDRAPARLAELKQLHADAIHNRITTAIHLLEITLESH